MKKKIYLVNLLGSSVCNLKCEYCYVPKVSELRNVHQKVNELIEDGSIVKYLQDKYDISELKHIGFWGAEPTLNLESSYKFLSDMMVISPIEEITIPTNFTTNIDNLISFIEKLKTFDKKISFHIQISIDGPEFITDVNRGVGTTDKVLRNLFYFIEKMQNVDLEKITLRVDTKSTWSNENLVYIENNLDRLRDIQIFRDDIRKKIEDLNKKEGLNISFFHSGNLALPGEYLPEDGRRLGGIFQHISDDNIENPIFDFFYRAFKKIENRDLFSRFDTVSCGGSKSGVVAIGEDFYWHPCHRTFHIRYDGHGKHDYDFAEQYMKSDLDKMDFMMMSYHSFLRLTVNLTVNMILEMAECGQVLEKYKDKDNAFLLALFMCMSINCPVEGLLENFNHFSFPVSSIRLLGNGVLDVMIEHHRRKACLI